MVQVDRIMEAEAGVESSDIEDWAYWDAWDAGKSPAKAAGEALRAAGWRKK
jgi:hypothetical protein